MKVFLAQPRGFCAGVVRAIDTVELALERFGTDVYVRHEIVHNRHVVQALEAKGARFVEELSEVPDGAVTIFSAHGVSREVEREARQRGLPVIDATCPLVSKVHKNGRRYADSGRTIVLIGHAGHPEVVGTIGQIDREVHIVASVADVEALPIAADAPVAYITQTTLSVSDTQGIIAALGRRFANLIGPDTRDICYATQNRQMAVRELAKFVEVLLVVGATNSSNTNRLREIGAEQGVPTFLVADGSQVTAAMIEGRERIGITAGASAPEVLVQDVIRTLRQFGPVEVTEMAGIKEQISFRLPDEFAPLRQSA